MKEYLKRTWEFIKDLVLNCTDAIVDLFSELGDMFDSDGDNNED